ncbi:MAG: HEPN domain-containing protein [Alphaproteobacteria bacterium]
MRVPLTDEERVWVRTHAKYLRDVADQDYVMARIAYRRCFVEAFVWNSSQAIEKCLKVILLYGQRKVRKNHSIKGLFFDIMAILDIRIEVSQSQRRFLASLEAAAAVRYWDAPSRIEPGALEDLDATYFAIRRYAVGLEVQQGDVVLQRKMRAAHLRMIPDVEAMRDQLQTGVQGYLERVLRGHALGAVRADLVWNNQWFKSTKRKGQRSLTSFQGANAPPHLSHPARDAAVKKMFGDRRPQPACPRAANS